MAKHLPEAHAYVDDSQLYFSFKPESSNSQREAIKVIEQCPTWGSQWGGGFYGYRLNFLLFYGYRLIFFQLRLTKKLKTDFFCFKELNIN